VEGQVGWAESGQRRKKRGRPAGLGWCGGGKKKKRGGLEREGLGEREGVFSCFYFTNHLKKNEFNSVLNLNQERE
jgi:hypothetical protein